MQDNLQVRRYLFHFNTTQIKGLALHSAQVQPGWGFVTVLGPKGDGLERGLHYARLAQQAGATALFVEGSAYRAYASVGLPVVPMHKLGANLRRLADRYYGRDTLAWCGITGTNGKSSVAHLLAQGLNACGVKCAVVGTVYQGLPDQTRPAGGMTTPDIFELRRLGYQFVQQGVQHVALECSSHGLDQERVAGLNITDGILTNVSPEHRDYHGEMKNYVAAKKKLFARRSLQRAVFNHDDIYGQKWFRQYKRGKHCLTFSLHDRTADLCLKIRRKDLNGISARLQTPWGSGMLRSATPTAWALGNKMAALGVMLLQGIALQPALRALNAASDLDGRMQRLFGSQRGPNYFVDYAHTPAALRATLEDLRPLCRGQLWVVFGCGGGRDQVKRGEMGSLAAEWADRIVLTNDNPRDEAPAAILAAIIRGMPAAGRRRSLMVESDRWRALELVASEARSNDIVLVAGKGHENYQEIAGCRSQFSDYAALRTMIHA